MAKRCWSCVSKKIGIPAGQGRIVIEAIRQGLFEEGVEVSISKICRYLGIPRRTVYYRPVKSVPKVKPELEAPIKALIEQEPSFGYRTVAGLLGMSKNTVQRISGSSPAVAKPQRRPVHWSKP
jgi:DNA invertase Pin-like site-specific DNA recombinase